MSEERNKFGSGLVLAGMLVMFFGSIVFCTQVFGFFNDGVWTSLPGTYYFSVRLPEKEAEWYDYLGSRGLSRDQVRRLTAEQRRTEQEKVESARRLLRYIPHGLMQEETWWTAPETAVGFHNLLTSVLDTLGMAGSVLVLGFLIFLAGLYWI